jgi:thiol-disulfide isomerase/thioredoxin
MKLKIIKLLSPVLFTLLLTSALSSPLLAQTVSTGSSSGKIGLYFFYAQDCQPCKTILEGYLPALKPIYPSLEVETFDVGNPVHYEALSRLEKQFGKTESELPVVMIGNHLLSGEMEVMGRLEPLVQEYQARGGASLPPVEPSSVTKPSRKSYTADVIYFYQKGCPKCDRANALLKYLLKKYPGLKMDEIDLNTPDGKRLNETLSNRLNLPVEKRLIAPSLFIGRDYLPPEEIIESKIEALIGKYGEKSASESKPALTTPIPAPAPAPSPTQEEFKKAEESIVARFKSLGILTVLSAGLIDGINPCAFATLIFFISYLTFVGRKRREILWVGIGFSGAIFTTYLLIGLGILSFIQHLTFLPLFSRIVYLLTILIALILGTLSLYDYLQLKRGRPSEMKLQLPDFFKKRIHQTIRKESKATRYFVAAIVAGFTISLLEFACTGQVYLPTILFVMNVPSLRGEAFLYLFLYNFMFVLPLLIIFGVTYLGVTSGQLSFFLQKRVATIKLLTALFFFLLAGILIFSLR